MSNRDPQTPDEPRDRSGDRPTQRPRASGFDDAGQLKSSRSGALYLGLIVAAVLAVLVLIFILQNSASTTIRFLGFEGSFPTGVAILLAAVLGMLIVAVPGSIRIFQLRRSLTRNEKNARHQD